MNKSPEQELADKEFKAAVKPYINQDKWDEQLLHCWKHELNMRQLVARYFDAIGVSEEMIPMKDMCEIIAFGGMKRALEISGRIQYSSHVRTVVAAACTRLSGLLMDGHSVAVLLPTMICYKWRVRKKNTKDHTLITPKTEYGFRQPEYVIKVRAATKATDWKTVG